MADQKFYIIDQNEGELVPIKLIDNGDDSGFSISVSGISGGGGGSGDASASNQVTQINNIGATNVASATTDTGTFSLIALIKRLLTKVPAFGQAVKASSWPIVIASDQEALAIRGDRGTYTDRSGTITTGNTAQTLMASNSTRSTYFIQNLSSTDLYVSFVGTAVLTQPSIRIVGGATLSPGSFVSTQAISIIGATTGQVFTSYEA